MENLRRKSRIFKNGFTLAEVLITLVIIGVVAALTISPLINTYVESSTVSKVKKGLSILGQAKKLAEVQNGSLEAWDYHVAGDRYASVSKFWDFLKPYITVTKDCGSGTDCYQSDGTYRLNGLLYFENFNTLAKYYKVILADGSVMWFKTAINKCSDSNGGLSNVCAEVWYDVNGTKKPNTLGRDIFLYHITPDGVYPYMSNGSWVDCTLESEGWSCSSYIIKQGNMNYLH